jgi:hypothetical protein
MDGDIDGCDTLAQWRKRFGAASIVGLDVYSIPVVATHIDGFRSASVAGISIAATVFSTQGFCR